MRQSKRVPGSGRYARGFFMPFGVAFVVTSLVDLLNGDGDTATEKVLQLIFLALGIAAVALSARIGVWLHPGHVVVRSWLRTRRYPITPALVCTWEQYSGIISAGWEDLWHLNVIILDGSSVWSVRALIAFRKSALRQTRLINNYIAMAEPRGTRGRGSQVACVARPEFFLRVSDAHAVS